MKIPTYKMFRHYSILALEMFILSLIVISCGNSKINEIQQTNESKETIKLNKKQFKAVKLNLGNWTERVFYNSIPVNGHFEVPPENKIIISSHFGGRVKEFKLLIGSKVRKNQDLFILENPEFLKLQEAFLNAKGQIKYLKANLDRQKALLSDQLTSEKNFFKSESDYLHTLVQMNSIDKQLKLMSINSEQLSPSNLQSSIVIKAPFSGYISSIKTMQGANIEPTQEALTLVNPEFLHLELFAFEKDVPNLKKGQKIRFHLQSQPNKIYDAKLELINHSMDTNQKTMSLHAEILSEDLDGVFHPGLFVEASIMTDETKGFALPKKAVTMVDGKYYTLVLLNSKDSIFEFQKREVILGKSNENEIQIINTNDFDPKSQFLLNGVFQLISD